MYLLPSLQAMSGSSEEGQEWLRRDQACVLQSILGCKKAPEQAVAGLTNNPTFAHQRDLNSDSHLWIQKAPGREGQRVSLAK